MTPWELQMRVRGYARRQKNRRLFTASFITAPMINAGYNRPKRNVTVQKLLPDDFHVEVSPAKKESLMKFAEEQERRRKHGRP